MNEQDSSFEKKIIILSISFVLFMLLILPLTLTFLIRIIPGGVQPSLGNTEKIYSDIILSQSFISPEDNLVGIGVSIKNPNFANKKKLLFQIFDDENLIKTIDLNGQNIADGKFVKILFEPIKSAKNKKFVWSVSSAESSLDEALEIFLTDKKPSWSLDLKITDKLSDQTLSYVTLHQPLNRTEVLGKVVKGWIDKIIKDSIFFSVYAFILLVLLLFIFAKSPLKNSKKSS